MASIMNTNINDGGGAWGSADTIQYESSNISSIKSDLQQAISYLDEVKIQIGNLESYDSQWRGKAKGTYVDLKTILNQYYTDYRVSVENLKTCVNGLETLLNDIPSAEVIKEIKNA